LVFVQAILEKKESGGQRRTPKKAEPIRMGIGEEE
jgi:hypothetical protein